LGAGCGVAVYSTKPYDAQFLTAANSGHDLVFLEPRLSVETDPLAVDADAVCAVVNDDLGEAVLDELARLGVRHIALRSAGFNHVDLPAAERLGMLVTRVPGYSPYAVAEHGVALGDDVFSRLLTFPNVLITGHQAFFTAEALENRDDDDRRPHRGRAGRDPAEPGSRSTKPERVWDTRRMASAVLLDSDAIRVACERYGVARLRVFGSALTAQFDPERSDVDFLVDFIPDNDNLFNDYFDLKAELERIVGREVDLVDASAVQNPYFKATAFGSAQDVYAA
jgi:predicted nucleotidyltransferase